MAKYEMVCVGCGKAPSEIAEYVDAAKALDVSPERFVMVEEGTYNKYTGHFYCTQCYVDAGCPLGKAE